MRAKHLLAAAVGAIAFLGAEGAQAGSGGPCREYTKTISIGGRLEVGYGRACRQPDGAWEIAGLSGNDYARHSVGEHIRNDLYARGETRVIFVDRPVAVYQPRPVYYYAPPPRYYYPARPVFHDRGWHRKDYRGNHGHGHGRKHDDRHGGWRRN